MTTTNEKEEEWKRLRDMESEAERNKRIGEAQKEGLLSLRRTEIFKT